MFIPERVSVVLKKLNISDAILLGNGGEGYIFSYKSGDVIKIFTKDAINYSYLQNLAEFQKKIVKANLPFATPEIKEIRNLDGTFYTIEKRLFGINMEQKFPTIGTKSKFFLLKSYYEAIKSLNTLEFSNLPYGNIIASDTAIHDITWQSFILKKIEQRIKWAGEKIWDDVSDLDIRLQQFTNIVNKDLFVSTKNFVHADYFINQVMVNEKNEISAILDISYHAVVGDKRLDMASVPFFYDDQNYSLKYINYLIELEKKDFGDIILKYNDIYKIYYCLYCSNIYKYFPKLYNSVVRNLNDENLWKRIS